MNSDLKWLALNVPEWKGDEYSHVKRFTNCVLWLPCPGDCYMREGEVWFTREQLEAAQDELSSKPSWSDAPVWAEWLAQNSFGGWWWYIDKPCWVTMLWVWESLGHEHPASFGRCIKDWTLSLEPRPSLTSLCESLQEPLEQTYTNGQVETKNPTTEPDGCFKGKAGELLWKIIEAGVQYNGHSQLNFDELEYSVLVEIVKQLEDSADLYGFIEMRLALNNITEGAIGCNVYVTDWWRHGNDVGHKDRLLFGVSNLTGVSV